METKQPLRDVQNVTKPAPAVQPSKPEARSEHIATKPKLVTLISMISSIS